MPIYDMPLAAVMNVIQGAVMVLFIISSFLVILVVLAQEGKGGGLAGAFGGAGSETFGVKAGTVNKFTAWLAAAFLGLALLHAGLSTAEPVVTAPETIADPGADDVEGSNEAGDPAKNEKKPADGDKKDAPVKDAPVKDAPVKDEPVKDEKKPADGAKKDK